LENWTRRLRPFSGDPELTSALAVLRDQKIALELTDTASLEYKAGQFMRAALFADPAAARWCRENKVAITKASATTPNSAGGVLLPDEVAAAVLLLIEEYGVIPAEAATWSLHSDSLVVPRNSVGMTMAWIGEGSTISSLTPSFDGLQLTPRKLGGYLKVSNELMEDAPGVLGAWFICAAARGVGKSLDQAAFVGDGSSSFGGIIGIQSSLSSGAKVTASSGTWTSLTGTDIGSTVGALGRRALDNAKIYISMTGYGTLVRLAGANGGLVATIENGKLKASYHGLPVVITNALPTSASVTSGKLMMVVSDLAQAVAYGVRRDLSVMAFSEFAPEVDQTLIRVTTRCDISAHDCGSVGDGSSAAVGLFAP
jgi:HK97 family phage major capsid protein